MKKETRILGRPPGGIVMLLLSCAAIGANGATIMQTREFSFLPHAVRTLAFDKFDNNGGGSTLTGVHITTNEYGSMATLNRAERVILSLHTWETWDPTEMKSAPRPGISSGLAAIGPVWAGSGTGNDPEGSNFQRGGSSLFHHCLPDVAVSDSAYTGNQSSASPPSGSGFMPTIRKSGGGVSKSVPLSITCMAVCGALMIRRRPH